MYSKYTIPTLLVGVENGEQYQNRPLPSLKDIELSAKDANTPYILVNTETGISEISRSLMFLGKNVFESWRMMANMCAPVIELAKKRQSKETGEKCILC